MTHSSTTPGPVSAIVGQRALLVHPLLVSQCDLHQQPGQQQVHHAVGHQSDPPQRAHHRMPDRVVGGVGHGRAGRLVTPGPAMVALPSTTSPPASGPVEGDRLAGGDPAQRLVQPDLRPAGPGLDERGSQPAVRPDLGHAAEPAAGRAGGAPHRAGRP